MQAQQLWSTWQALALDAALGFTHPGERRFVEWGTGLALNVEEHTITQSLIGLDRVGDWKALESNAWVRLLGPPHPAVRPGRPPRPPARPHLARLLRLGRRRHQGPPLQQGRLGHLHLP